MLCVLGSAVAFAVAPIFGKVAYAHGVDSFALLALRFASASLVVWVMVLVLGVGGDVGRPAGRTVLRVLALGALVLPAEVTLYFASLHRIGAGLAEVLLFLYPMWVVLITAVVLRQQVTRLVVGCSVVAVAGAALTVGAVSGVDGVGVLLAVGASIGFACYVVLSGRLVHGVGSILTTALITTGAAVTFSVAALVTGSQGPTDAAGWAATLGLSLVGTVVSTVEPAVAVLLGVVLLGEPIGPLQVVGVALVLGSVAVLVRVEAAEDVVDAGAGH